MSHVVEIQTKVHDPAAACQRLSLAAPVQGTVRLYSGEATGLIVRLPGWPYPAVVEPLTGTIRYDIFQGRWGALRALAMSSAQNPALGPNFTKVIEKSRDRSVFLRQVYAIRPIFGR